MNIRRLSVLACLLVSATAPLGAQTAEAWIAKARTFLGGDAALSAVKSIHFTGTLEAGTTRLATDIIFQKPYQQRIMVQAATVIETTALDGYDAWQKRTNPANPAQWQVTLMDGNQVKRLRSNTAENLSFYAIQDMPDCEAAVTGEAIVDGKTCVKLTFTHDSGVVFVRFFDQGTGQLVKTETENGGEIREEGEIFVQGVRFPQRVINKAPDGKITAISFTTITVNEAFPSDLFAVPSLQGQGR